VYSGVIIFPDFQFLVAFAAKRSDSGIEATTLNVVKSSAGASLKLPSEQQRRHRKFTASLKAQNPIQQQKSEDGCLNRGKVFREFPKKKL
jgi:hypothetical protein